MQPLISAKNGGHELHAACRASAWRRAACVRAWIDAVEHLRGAEEERVGGRWRGDGRSEDCDQRRRVPK
jgi:hypothetical protein